MQVKVKELIHLFIYRCLTLPASVSAQADSPLPLCPVSVRVSIETYDILLIKDQFIVCYDFRTFIRAAATTLPCLRMAALLCEGQGFHTSDFSPYFTVNCG